MPGRKFPRKKARISKLALSLVEAYKANKSSASVNWRPQQIAPIGTEPAKHDRTMMGRHESNSDGSGSS